MTYVVVFFTVILSVLFAIVAFGLMILGTVFAVIHHNFKKFTCFFVGLVILLFEIIITYPIIKAIVNLIILIFIIVWIYNELKNAPEL